MCILSIVQTGCGGIIRWAALKRNCFIKIVERAYEAGAREICLSLTLEKAYYKIDDKRERNMNARIDELAKQIKS